MIGTISSIVSKVVGTVSGPLHSWGPKQAVRKPSKAVKAAKSGAKAKKCRNCGKKCKCN
ncbi:hypothetical protein L0Y65_03915 [Candidatus Micrarchaeota archaeon]|nr:hypothetical protein [Candidatus Micrarchaeota archaeon]